MQNVVVPIDDPVSAMLALRTAFSLARRVEISVELLHVSTNGAAAEHEQLLREAAQRFSAVAPSTVDVIKADDPVDVILARAEERDALVCMPTRGRGALSRLLFGSVADGVVRQSTRPILCLGPEARHVALPGESIEALVCSDGSASGPVVVSAAADFASMLRASCLVTQVIGPDEDIGPAGTTPPRPLRERAEQHTEEGAKQLRDRGVSASSAVIPGRAGTSLPGFAQSRSMAFVVVGTSGLTGVPRVALGSVASDVVRQAVCPVLIVPTWNVADNDGQGASPDR